MVTTTWRIAPVVALLAALLTSGCVARVRVRGVATSYDTNQCYWTWMDDGYGGYEQMYCYSPAQASYVVYYNQGVAVRRYPGWYRGRRTVVVAPRVRIVRPQGVVIRARPIRPPRATVIVR